MFPHFFEVYKQNIWENETLQVICETGHTVHMHFSHADEIKYQVWANKAREKKMIRRAFQDNEAFAQEEKKDVLVLY